jgi:hypothetical protein
MRAMAHSAALAGQGVFQAKATASKKRPGALFEQQ